jgi:hypothetical protein
MTTIEWFHPFVFMGKDSNEFVSCYGFSLDLKTEIYYYTYDWGYGFNLQILGFGFEINKTKI